MRGSLAGPAPVAGAPLGAAGTAAGRLRSAAPRLRAAPWAIAAAALLPATAHAQNTHILMISGLGGDPEYTESFHGWLSRFADAATEKYGVPAERIIYLGEDPDLDPTRIRARSTAENIRTAFADLAGAMGPSDELVVLLAGHGSFRDETARFNVPGPDITPAELGILMAPLDDRRITFVNTASASGPFIEALSGPNRTIITATRSGRERNMTRFGLHFVDAFADEGADVNKDSRVSMLEAFGYALREVERQYEGDRQLLTEHAVLDDNGDGEGSREPGELEGDGLLASTIFLTSLGGAGADEAVTAELRALYEEKADIEARIADLRRIKERMPLERYEDELEALLVELALKNREIRAAGGGTEGPG